MHGRVCRVDPQGSGLVKEAGLPAAARIDLDKARHSRCYAAMTRAFEASKPLTDKYRALIQGYAMRDAQKGDAFKKLLATLEQKEIELECFEVLTRPAPACAGLLKRTRSPIVRYHSVVAVQCRSQLPCHGVSPGHSRCPRKAAFVGFGSSCMKERAAVLALYAMRTGVRHLPS